MKHFKLSIPTLVVGIVSLLLFYLLQSCGGVHYDSYLEDYSDIAMKEMQRTGYPASIKLAQAILESEGGRSVVANQYNNHFGIPCGNNWPGKRYFQEERDFQTGDREEACYRVYNNPESSFVAHTDLLRKDYKSLFYNMDPMDYRAWASRLGEMEYSGSEDYSATIISMIERYRLDEFDEIAMGFDDYASTRPTSTSSDKEYEEPTEYDRPSKKKNRSDRYREELEELEDNIDNHRRKYYKRPKREKQHDHYEDGYEGETPRRTYDPYEEEPPQRKTYESTTYDPYEESDYYEPTPKREDYTSTSQSEWDTPARRSYPRTSGSAKYNPSTIDDKYEGFSEPTSTYSSPSRNQGYNKPSYPKRREPTTTYAQEEWEEEETTSISDFRREEDYAYINGVKVTTARYDDTPLLIAKRFNISVRDIIGYNEHIKSNKQLLREDQKIFLQAKKKNYDGERRHHIVQFGERMENIADMYGLSLSALYSKNKMPEGSEPALGEKIKLDRGKARKRPELRYKAPKPLSNPSYDSSTGEVPPSMPIGSDISSATTQRATVLLQPVIAPNVMYHIVQPGETLYRISQQYAISTEDIKRMNNLSSTTIRRGWRLKVK